jgi:hypothetical protein
LGRGKPVCISERAAREMKVQIGPLVFEQLKSFQLCNTLLAVCEEQNGQSERDLSTANAETAEETTFKMTAMQLARVPSTTLLLVVLSKSVRGNQVNDLSSRRHRLMGHKLNQTQ